MVSLSKWALRVDYLVLQHCNSEIALNSTTKDCTCRNHLLRSYHSLNDSTPHSQWHDAATLGIPRGTGGCCRAVAGWARWFARYGRHQTTNTNQVHFMWIHSNIKHVFARPSLALAIVLVVLSHAGKQALPHWHGTGSIGSFHTQNLFEEKRQVQGARFLFFSCAMGSTWTNQSGW